MATLFGPDGKPLAAPLRHPRGDDGVLARNKAKVQAWLRVVGAADEAGGRGEHNWRRPPRKCLTQAMVDGLRRRGMAVYVTPGQFIVADLTGENPRVRQRRPLAERYVELCDGIEGHA